jgi:hypothetical protein
VSERLRGIAAIAIGLGVSGFLLHGTISDALVFRGDGVSYQRGLQAAIPYYRRAVMMDRGSRLALDRLAFAVWFSHDEGSVAGVLAMLDAHPMHAAEDAELAIDRALIEKSHGMRVRAGEDFVLAGTLRNDARLRTTGMRLLVARHEGSSR